MVVPVPDRYRGAGAGTGAGTGGGTGSGGKTNHVIPFPYSTSLTEAKISQPAHTFTQLQLNLLVQLTLLSPVTQGP